MTELEKRAIQALQNVAMTTRNWHAGRAGFLYTRMVVMPETQLKPTQAGDLWFLVWTYRRQIADREVVAKADEIVNGALQLAYHGEQEG